MHSLFKLACIVIAASGRPHCPPSPPCAPIYLPAFSPIPAPPLGSSLACIDAWEHAELDAELDDWDARHPYACQSDHVAEMYKISARMQNFVAMSYGG
jgi:hypothetical protein